MASQDHQLHQSPSKLPPPIHDIAEVEKSRDPSNMDEPKSSSREVNSLRNVDPHLCGAGLNKLPKVNNCTTTTTTPTYTTTAPTSTKKILHTNAQMTHKNWAWKKAPGKYSTTCSTIHYNHKQHWNTAARINIYTFHFISSTLVANSNMAFHVTCQPYIKQDYTTGNRLTQQRHLTYSRRNTSTCSL